MIRMFSQEKFKLVKIVLEQFFLRLVAMLLLLAPTYGAVHYPATMQNADFLPIFYTTGRMAHEGKACDLYSCPANAASYETPLRNYAHQIFNNLPVNAEPFFHYPPLLAYLLEPISCLTPQAAFIVWQVISIVALAVSVLLLVQASTPQAATLHLQKWGRYFWLSILYFPIVHTLFLGQMGIVIVLLPLSLGYFLLMRERPILAGLAWSFLFLKLQFLPIAFLLVGSLLIGKHWRCAIGFVAGLFLLGIANALCFGPEIAHQWLAFLRASDTLLSDPAHSYSAYLQVSAPRVVAQLFPQAWQTTIRMALYLVAAGVALQALWLSGRLVRKAGSNYLAAMPYIFALGIFLMPLISPHLLFYDLSILALAGMVVWGQSSEGEAVPGSQGSNLIRAEEARASKPTQAVALQRDLLLGWLAADLYWIAFVFIHRHLAQPLMMVVVLAWLYWRILRIVQNKVANWGLA